MRGKGKELFVDPPETKLKLVETRPFVSGVVALIYGRAGKEAPKPRGVVPSPKAKPQAKAKSKGMGERLRYAR